VGAVLPAPEPVVRAHPLRPRGLPPQPAVQVSLCLSLSPSVLSLTLSVTHTHTFTHAHTHTLTHSHTHTLTHTFSASVTLTLSHSFFFSFSLSWWWSLDACPRPPCAPLSTGSWNSCFLCRTNQCFLKSGRIVEGCEMHTFCFHGSSVQLGGLGVQGCGYLNLESEVTHFSREVCPQRHILRLANFLFSKSSRFMYKLSTGQNSCVPHNPFAKLGNFMRVLTSTRA